VNMAQNVMNTSNSVWPAGEGETVKSQKANRTNSTSQKRKSVSFDSELSTSELHISNLPTSDSNKLTIPNSDFNTDSDSDSVKQPKQSKQDSNPRS